VLRAEYGAVVLGVNADDLLSDGVGRHDGRGDEQYENTDADKG